MLLLMLGISGETGKCGEHPEKLGVCKPLIQTSVSKRHPLYVMMCEVHRHFRLSRLSSWKVYLFLTQKDVFQTCVKGQRLHQSLQVFVDWFQGLSQEPSQENQDWSKCFITSPSVITEGVDSKYYSAVTPPKNIGCFFLTLGSMYRQDILLFWLLWFGNLKITQLKRQNHLPNLHFVGFRLTYPGHTTSLDNHHITYVAMVSMSPPKGPPLRPS